MSGPERMLSRAFALAFVSHFLHALSFNLYLHFPGFLKQLGATELLIGVISGVTAATSIAARPVLGRVLDLRGRRFVIVAGGALSVVVCALYLTLTALGPWVYIVRALHGVSEAMLFASLFAYAADIVPATRRIEGIALFGVSGMLPAGLGGLLGDALLARGGFPMLFATSIGCSPLALLLSLPLREAPRSGGEAPRGLVAAMTQRNLLPLWFAGIVFATTLAAHYTFLKTFVLTTGFGSVGLFFTAYSVAAVLLRLTMARLPERVGPKRVLAPALASMAAGFVVLATARGGAAVGVAGALCGLGHGFTFPILLGLVVSRSRPSERGAALAVFTALFDGGTLIGGPALGVVIREAGYGAMFLTAAGLITLGGGVFAVWDRRSA